MKSVVAAIFEQEEKHGRFHHPKEVGIIWEDVLFFQLFGMPPSMADRRRTKVAHTGRWGDLEVMQCDGPGRYP